MPGAQKRVEFGLALPDNNLVLIFFLLYCIRVAEEARTMLQGVGSRFDFHVCKTLCDLRYGYLSTL